MAGTFNVVDGSGFRDDETSWQKGRVENRERGMDQYFTINSLVRASPLAERSSRK